MKSISFIKVLLILAIFLFPTMAVAGNEPSDPLRSNGLIYVVICVIAIIFSGIVVYLLIQDRKLSKIEKQINDTSNG